MITLIAVNWTDFIKNAIYPESYLDILIFSLIVIIGLPSFLFGLGIIKRTLKSFIIVLLILIVIAIAYWQVMIKGIPLMTKFNSNEIGVLICNLSGHDLKKYYGDNEINYVLSGELNERKYEFEKKFDLQELESILIFHPISWIIYEEEQARRIMRKYDASAALWGNVVLLNNKAKLSVFLELSDIVFKLPFPTLKNVHPAVRITAGPDFQLNLTDSSYNLDCFARQIINNLLPVIAARISSSDPELAVKIIERMPNIDSSYLQAEYSGFFLAAAANTLDQLNRTEKAEEFYNLAYCYLGKLYRRRIADEADLDYPLSLIQRYASFCKLREGRIKQKKGNIGAAELCYLQCLLTSDESTRESLVSDLRKFGLNYNIGISSPFPDVIVIDSIVSRKNNGLY